MRLLVLLDLTLLATRVHRFLLLDLRLHGSALPVAAVAISPPASSRPVSLTAIPPVPLCTATGDALHVAVAPAAAVAGTYRAAGVAVVELVAAAAGISARAVQTLALLLPIAALPLVVAERASVTVAVAVAITVPVPVSVSIAVTVISPVADGGETAGPPVRPLAVCLGFTAVCLIGVGLRGTAETAGRRPSLPLTSIRLTVAVVTVDAVIMITSAIAQLALPLCVFFLLLKTADDLFKGRLAKFIGLDSLVFFQFLYPGAHLLPSVSGANGRVKMLDTRAERINGATLMAVSCVLLVFSTAYDLFLKTLENELEDLRIDISCTAISAHQRIELFEGGFRGDLITVILGWKLVAVWGHWYHV